MNAAWNAEFWRQVWQGVKTYDSGNKLLSVTDTGIAPLSVKGQFQDQNTSGNDYTYDDNGNMISDANKEITNISYNHLNLPELVSLASGNITYIYDATGIKLEKVVTEGSSVTKTKYAGNFVYEKLRVAADELKFFNHPEGYVEPDSSGGYDYVYQYKDHLGNIRLSYKDSNGDGVITAATEIQEENNYYPFGLKHKGYNNVVNGTDHKYGYNGVEETNEFGYNMLEMDMRQYDPAIGRWTSIDPITHFSNSTYNGFDNNPIFWADPSGADAENMRLQDLDGNWHTISSNDYITVYNASDGDGDKDKKKKKKSDGLNKASTAEISIGGYKLHKNHDEIDYYRNNPETEDIVNAAAFRAGHLASMVSNVLGGGNDGYGDAIRHSYWMYLIATELGPEMAQFLGDMHENFTPDVGKNKGRNNMTTPLGKMDLHNNNWGINLAKVNPNLNYLEYEEKFFKAVQNKELIIINTNTIPPQSLKQTIEYRRKRREEVKQDLKMNFHKRMQTIKY